MHAVPVMAVLDPAIYPWTAGHPVAARRRGIA